jgi:hypothetical protein
MLTINTQKEQKNDFFEEKVVFSYRQIKY